MPLKYYPTHYTIAEGEEWRPWRETKGIWFWELWNRDAEWVPLAGHVVHSLRFELDNPNAGNSAAARWDCINGWTTTFKDLKRAK